LLWLVDSWIWLDLPSAALVVDGELEFRGSRSWGTAPVDRRPPMASSGLQGRVSTSTPLKARGDGELPVHGGSRRPLWRQRWATTIPSASGALWIRGPQYIFFFSKVLSVVWQGQLYPYPPCMRTCTLSLSSNAEMYYKKNEMRSPLQVHSPSTVPHCRYELSGVGRVGGV
jgi:hypothetical protein